MKTVAVALQGAGSSNVEMLAQRRHAWVEFVPTVSLVVPTLNEERNLAHVLTKVPTWVTEVIIVDGHSKDGTVALAQRLYPGVKVVYQTGKGKGNALQAGFAAATGEIIAAIDADGSMDPTELYAYVGALMAGADLAKGSRFIQGGGTTDMEAHRKLGNWGLMQVARIFFGGRFSDLCYGYFAFWSRCLDDLHPDVDGFEIETLINVRALRARLVVAEIPSREAQRVNGQSNLKAIRDGFRILFTIIREWRTGRRRPAFD